MLRLRCGAHTPGSREDAHSAATHRDRTPTASPLCSRPLGRPLGASTSGGFSGGRGGAPPPPSRALSGPLPPDLFSGEAFPAAEAAGGTAPPLRQSPPIRRDAKGVPEGGGEARPREPFPRPPSARHALRTLLTAPRRAQAHRCPRAEPAAGGSRHIAGAGGEGSGAGVYSAGGQIGAALTSLFGGGGGLGSSLLSGLTIRAPHAAGPDGGPHAAAEAPPTPTSGAPPRPTARQQRPPLPPATPSGKSDAATPLAGDSAPAPPLSDSGDAACAQAEAGAAAATAAAVSASGGGGLLLEPETVEEARARKAAATAEARRSEAAGALAVRRGAAAEAEGAARALCDAERDQQARSAEEDYEAAEALQPAVEARRGRDRGGGGNAPGVSRRDVVEGERGCLPYASPSPKR